MQFVSIHTLAQNDVAPVSAAPAGPAAPAPAGAPTATGTQAPGAPAGATPAAQPRSGLAEAFPLLMLMAAFAFLFIFQARASKKEKQKREQLYSSLKKGDKVQTIGGALGVIAEVREHDVIVKVDDSTRIKFVKSAIASVVEGDGEGDKPK